MKCNEGKLDRSIRIFFGLLILILGFYFRNLLGLVGLLPLITGIVGFCPAYSILNINTNIGYEKEYKEIKNEEKNINEIGNKEALKEKNSEKKSKK